MQEFTFEEARKLLEEGKCTKIKFGYWLTDSFCYLKPGGSLWFTCHDIEYNTDYFGDWRSYPWYCLDLKPEVETKIEQKEEPEKMKEITEYIYRNRNGNRAKVGLLYATSSDFGITIGYSLCSPEDKFSRDKALSIARGRAINNRRNILDCPPSINREVQEFIERCKRYFKTTEFHTHVF